MTTMSRTAQMEKNLKKKACPSCQTFRLVLKRPRVYDQVRCMNCGKVWGVHENIPEN